MDAKKKTFLLDDYDLELLDSIKNYLDKKYGIDSRNGALKYLIRKGDELAKENRL